LHLAAPEKRDGEAVLKVTGREVEEQSLGLRFSKEKEYFGWQFTGRTERIPASAYNGGKSWIS
jgi:hypothetical protein